MKFNNIPKASFWVLALVIGSALTFLSQTPGWADSRGHGYGHGKRHDVAKFIRHALMAKEELGITDKPAPRLLAIKIAFKKDRITRKAEVDLAKALAKSPSPFLVIRSFLKAIFIARRRVACLSVMANSSLAISACRMNLAASWRLPCPYPCSRESAQPGVCERNVNALPMTSAKTQNEALGMLLNFMREPPPFLLNN